MSELNKEIKMQPVTYHGSKFSQAPFIIGKIPPHKTYVEAFVGGGSVFFRKTPSDLEILNDTNRAIFLFFKVLRDKPEEFKRQVKLIPYSENEFKHAIQIYKNPKGFSDMKVAVSFYITSTQSFGGNCSNWAFGGGKKDTPNKTFFNRVDEIDKVVKRMRHAVICNRDALDIIKKYDSEDAFFYVDPPYPGSEQGPYKGYTLKDFKKLCDLLGTIRGKFLLSAYKILGFTPPFESYEWSTYLRSKNGHIGQGGKQEKRIEMLYHNLEE